MPTESPSLDETEAQGAPSTDHGTPSHSSQRRRKPEVSGAQTYIEDTRTLVYGLRYGEGIFYVTSDQKRLSADEAAREYLVLSIPSRRTRFSREAMEAFVARPSSVDVRAIYEELKALFERHVYWRSPHTPALLAVWVMGTYVFQVFMFFPYLALNSEDKRCGKSLVLLMMREVTFNATQLLLGATPATIFRDIHVNDSTCLLDEVETLTDADKASKSQMLAVLCGGFQKGGTVPRCDAQNGTYTTPTEYRVYGPKVLAGINETADVIRDRSLSIRMARKPLTVELVRFDVRALKQGLARLVDQLHLFGLMHVRKIVEAYARAETLPVPDGLDDRGRDICEPLFAIARVIGLEAEHDLRVAVQDVIAARRADDASTESELPTARAVLAADLGGKGTKVLRTSDALTLFKEAGLCGVTDERYAQAILRRLGIRSGTHRVDGAVLRGYKITRELLGGSKTDAAV